MKLKILAASIALISANLSAQTTTAYWDTSEYYKSRSLAPINADAAWARGFTGKGSTIAILDTGIDAKNTQFANRITLMKDFTGGNNMTDVIGHGTHVAGIAAAAHDGNGVEGVAFDANLIIGKVYNNTGLTTIPTILQALNWADVNNANVANLSSNITLPSQFTLQAKQIAPGIYTTIYTNSGALPSGLNVSQWAAAMPGQMVLVMAAGNDGAKTPGAQASLATATDTNGNLILGGRMLIAGNWNQQTNTIDPTSNQAGTLCAVAVNNVCKDKYTVSQFYLMAPGNAITSTVPTTLNNSGLMAMTGTSMSAPAISGAVAILHQEWPQLSGSAIVQLLLTTANKNLPNYDPTVMGQGLLDLNKATQPLGGLNIATKGNLANALLSTSPVTALISSTSGSASTTKISSVMMVDAIGRDYYTAGKNFTSTTSNPNGNFNVKQSAMPYTSRNNYSQINNYTDHISSRVGNVEMGLYIDNTLGNPSLAPVMADISYYHNLGSNTEAKFTVGSFSETNSWLGNSLTGYGTATGANSSLTSFVGAGITHNLDEINQVHASVMAGMTNTGASNGLVSSVGPIYSWTWNLGYEHKFDKENSVGFMAYQPPTIYSAQANGNIPVGLDTNYNIVTSGNIDLGGGVPEYRFGAYYKLNGKSGTNVLAFIENRQNVQGQEGVSSNVVGLLANARF